METDRNLLFGILALQADYITRSQFVDACAAWASRKEQTLAWLLVERGWLTTEDRLTVERFLQRKLQRDGGDLPATLAAVADPEVRDSLGGIPDAAIQHSLGGSAQLVRTIAYTPESHGRYTVTRLHATGGIGQVWLARDQALGREVALKDLRPEASANPKMAARFLEEAQITGQLEHPNIVPVYELARGSDEDRLYYTMRFVRGQTLAEKIKAFHQRRRDQESTPLEFRVLLTAFTSVCHAVTYAHSRGVIHRDLKPQNVILGNFGEVVLLDWGLAKLVDRPDAASDAPSVVLERTGVTEPTVQGQVLGTPAYMAPEQAEGRQELIDHRTDIYGLGAILYEILSGKPPYSGASTAAVLDCVLKAQPEAPAACGPRCRDRWWRSVRKPWRSDPAIATPRSRNWAARCSTGWPTNRSWPIANRSPNEPVAGCGGIHR